MWLTRLDAGRRGNSQVFANRSGNFRYQLMNARDRNRLSSV